MKLSFEYKGIQVNYNLMYKKTHAMAINIDSKGIVNVVAPIGTSVQTVMDKVKGNAPWIINELYQSHQKNRKTTLLEQYVYLGKSYGVEIVSQQDANQIVVKLLRGKFVIQTPTDNQEEIRNALITWYKEKVVSKLKERVKLYADFFKEIPAKIEAEDDPSILFQITTDRIFSNITVGMLTVEVIDYLLVSGLCGLNALGESSEETKKLQEVLPNYEESKEWLEKNKAQLLF